MVHGELNLIHGMTCSIAYRIGMFLLECDCECVKRPCMCT